MSINKDSGPVGEYLYANWPTVPPVLKDITSVATLHCLKWYELSPEYIL